MRMNSDMRPIYDSIRACDRVELRPDFAETVRRGWTLRGTRLYLAAHLEARFRYQAARGARPAEPDTEDDWQAEREVNEVYLETETPTDDPRWRAELLEQGLCLARSLLPEATKLTVLPVQAVIALQSALGKADPDMNFACGFVHFCVIRLTAR
jgi:hypothetical protein